ncbi:MAG: EamA family transporter [Thiobacillaceae bacterium]
MSSWLFPAFIAFVLWSLWAYIPKITTQHIDPRSALVFQAVGAFACGLVVLATLGFRPMLHERALPLALLTGVLGMAGGLAYLYAVARGPVTLISVLTALYPALTVLLANLFLDEAVSPRQWFGILLGLIAIVLVIG